MYKLVLRILIICHVHRDTVHKLSKNTSNTQKQHWVFDLLGDSSAKDDPESCTDQMLSEFHFVQHDDGSWRLTRDHVRVEIAVEGGEDMLQMTARVYAMDRQVAATVTPGVQNIYKAGSVLCDALLRFADVVMDTYES